MKTATTINKTITPETLPVVQYVSLGKELLDLLDDRSSSSLFPLFLTILLIGTEQINVPQ
jgi:hypothetical protein